MLHCAHKMLEKYEKSVRFFSGVTTTAVERFNQRNEEKLEVRNLRGYILELVLGGEVIAVGNHEAICNRVVGLLKKSKL